MRYSFVVAVFLGALTGVGGAEDEKPSKAQAALNEITKEILTWYKEKGGRPRTLADLKPLPALYAGKLLEHAKKNPKDPSAAEALICVVSHKHADTSKDGPRAQALALLRKDHLKGPTITRHVVAMMAHSGGVLTGLAQDVAATHPDKRTRVLAYRALIHVGEQLVRTTELLRGDEPEKFEKRFHESIYDRFGGPEAAKKMLKEALEAEAELPGYRAKLEGELKGVLPDVSVGAKAPPTQAADLKGKEVKLSDLKGKVVALHFWTAMPGVLATVMKPSDVRSAISATLREPRELVNEMKGRPFAFVSISTDDNKETVEKFLEHEPMPWMHWWVGPQSRLLETWNVQAQPMIYVIDHKGVIRHMWSIHDFQPRRVAEIARELVKGAEADAEKKGKDK
jgi:peroxiredoxin